MLIVPLGWNHLHNQPVHPDFAGSFRIASGFLIEEERKGSKRNVLTIVQKNLDVNCGRGWSVLALEEDPSHFSAWREFEQGSGLGRLGPRCPGLGRNLLPPIERHEWYCPSDGSQDEGSP